MPESVLVPAGSHRAVLTGVSLPATPPTRIYISGHEYLIQAPRVTLPTIANAVKLVLNYALPAARIAKNILHVSTPSGFNNLDPAQLQLLADQVFSKLTTGTSAIPNMFCSTTSLNSVTAKDMSGTSAVATSTHAPVPGVVAGVGQPPQVACTISWSFGGVWRGGKPRTYVPTPPISAALPAGSATMDPSFATSADTIWTALLAAINGLTIGSSTGFSLGFPSYFHGHVLRPTPQFWPFLGVRVHERFDSQRRRSGPEVIYAVTP